MLTCHRLCHRPSFRGAFSPVPQVALPTEDVILVVHLCIFSLPSQFATVSTTCIPSWRENWGCQCGGIWGQKRDLFCLGAPFSAAMAAVNLAQQAIISTGTPRLSTSSSKFFTAQAASVFLPPDLTSARRNARHSRGMATPECSSSGMTDSHGGRILRQVLSKEGRTKLNLASDRGFYSAPKLVTHVDDNFLSTLTNLYRERIPDGAEVLDLMSSWVSHLPAEKKYKRVVGHGLNAQELSRNRQLDHFFVKDLNAEPKLENVDGSFDAVVCTVSVQYLEQPEKVFAEIYRVLRPGGVCIVSFSNRMFYEKAVAAWRDGSDYSRTQLVKQYFQCIDGFTAPEVVKRLPPQEASPNPFSFITSLFASAGRDPFYAVVAYRNFKPIRE